jgi:hypothetical protein
MVKTQDKDSILLQAYAVMLDSLIHRTYCYLSVHSYGSINDINLIEKQFGIFEFNYNWSYSILAEKVAQIINETEQGGLKLVKEQIQFFDYNSRIMSNERVRIKK